MQMNSKSLAFVLAICISVIITGCLVLIPDVPRVAFWVIGLVSFAGSYLLINIILEFLFFRELRSIYDMFEQIRRNDLSQLEKSRTSGFGSLSQIYKEIYAYARNKQSEIDRLKQMAKFRRQFLADVSHELKTPIFAAQGFVHTLLDGAIDDKENRMKFLKKAAKNLDGLDALVKDLLTVSHMEAGEITMQKEPVNLVDMIYDIFDQMEDTALKNKIELKLNLARSEKLVVNADQNRVQQVLVNLISNAIKYSDSNSEVVVTLVEKEDKIEINVKDRGIGIPPEHLNRIFERFYRVDKSRSKAIGGTGLGLSIVKHIVEAHNGEVKVTSTVGEGSEFSFELEKYDSLSVNA